MEWLPNLLDLLVFPIMMIQSTPHRNPPSQFQRDVLSLGRTASRLETMGPQKSQESNRMWLLKMVGQPKCSIHPGQLLLSLVSYSLVKILFQFLGQIY